VESGLNRPVDFLSFACVMHQMCLPSNVVKHATALQVATHLYIALLCCRGVDTGHLSASLLRSKVPLVPTLISWQNLGTFKVSASEIDTFRILGFELLACILGQHHGMILQHPIPSLLLTTCGSDLTDLE
jgi:hypothetical protein